MADGLRPSFVLKRA